MISGPPCPPELPLSHCPHSDFYFPSPLGNQFIAPPQTVPRRSYNEPPLPTPVSPYTKSPKSSELRQPCTPHKCRSLINATQHTPDQPKTSQASTSPLPPPQPQPPGLSGPSRMEPSITTPSNCCTKELPAETPLPTVVPGIIKTVFPTYLPLCVPCDPILPNSYAKISPHGASMVSPCNTHVCSMVPHTSNPSVLSSSLIHPTRPPQGHNQPVMPPCGSYGAPRDPPLRPSKPVMPPCSTHIYSFIPLRTPFDPQCLPIVPRPLPSPDNVPCGLHTYTVASQGPGKECPQVPYSCPLPSPKSSTCSTDPSCSSTIVSECQSSDSQSKSSHQSKSWSQSRSQSRSKSPHDSQNRSRSSSLHQITIQDLSKSTCHGRSRKRNKSPHGGKSKGKSKSRSRSKSPHTGKSHGRSKSPQNKK
ncbi:5-methylcytosine rRNA methyltransferase NSUN4 isoform X1 [Fukomys damarensis]|uniref:5-methylcytosine rRNA methyltransferase NSUN4 isoform X1 n=1 Tax=Fukomys damarensis TaxID=885580 RepID=UPI0008FF4751|nr:5-methylcytosine rRNA methyltransferase NSUN4 isoform X1 [Fukomys damarensis]